MLTSVELQKTKVAEEKTRQANWKLENQRRRHNYVPVIFELLKQLAQKQQLETLFKEAVEKKEKAQEEKKQKAK